MYLLRSYFEVVIPFQIGSLLALPEMSTMNLQRTHFSMASRLGNFLNDSITQENMSSVDMSVCGRTYFPTFEDYLMITKLAAKETENIPSSLEKYPFNFK